MDDGRIIKAGLILAAVLMVFYSGCASEKENSELAEVLEDCGGLWEKCCDCAACDPGLTCDTTWKEDKQAYAYECVECGKKAQMPCHVCGGYDPISLTCCTGKPEVKACEGDMQACGYGEEYYCRECGCGDQRCCPGESCLGESYGCIKGLCVTWHCQTFINQCDTDKDCCVLRKCIGGECRVPCSSNEDCEGVSKNCSNGVC